MYSVVYNTAPHSTIIHSPMYCTVLCYTSTLLYYAIHDYALLHGTIVLYCSIVHFCTPTSYTILDAVLCSAI